ncbi:MAG: ComEC/Rec2 family competence protein [Microgenomates group bacterium]
MNHLLVNALIGIDNTLHEPYASLLKGLVYGIPIQIDPHLKSAIVQSGLAHLVVLSGTNITLLASLTERIFFFLGRKMGTMLQLVFLGMFTGMVGAQPPLMRAIFMFLCTTVCYMTGRPSYALWNLFLSLLCIAFIWPQWLETVSLHLSVAATIGIIISTRLKNLLPMKTPIWIDVLFESWIVFIITTPLTFFHFRTISLISPVSTALASWIIVPLMIGGLFISLAYRLLPVVTIPISSGVFAGLRYLLWVIEITSSIPFGYLQFK